jgi:predicted ABC-type ATPase
MSQIVLLAGPNGAGKTTAAGSVLAEELGIQEFVNADAIAAGLSPFNPDGVKLAAARIMLERIRVLLAQGHSFGWETTLATRSYVSLLKDAKQLGYSVHLLFLYLDSPHTAIQRVAQRVKRGGHYIPDADVLRRYTRGLRNFSALYATLVDSWDVYDNTEGKLIPVAQKAINGDISIHNPKVWTRITNQ